MKIQFWDTDRRWKIFGVYVPASQLNLINFISSLCFEKGIDGTWEKNFFRVKFIFAGFEIILPIFYMPSWPPYTISC